MNGALIISLTICQLVYWAFIKLRLWHINETHRYQKRLVNAVERNAVFVNRQTNAQFNIRFKFQIEAWHLFGINDRFAKLKYELSCYCNRVMAMFKFIVRSYGNTMLFCCRASRGCQLSL